MDATATNGAAAPVEGGNDGAGDNGQSEATPQELERLRVDGEEIELTREEMRALAQKGKSADQRWKEAATLRKRSEQEFLEAKRLREEAEELKSLYEKDWRAALTKQGKDPVAAAEELLAEKYKRQLMSPEELQRLELEEEKERWRTEKEAWEQERQAEKDDHLKSAAIERLDGKVAEVLSKSRLPKTPGMVARIADTMCIVEDNYGYRPSVEEATRRAYDSWKAETRAFISQLEPDELMDFAGEDNLARLRKHDIDRLKAEPERYQKPQANRPGRREPQKQGLTEDEWREQVKRRLYGG